MKLNLLIIGVIAILVFICGVMAIFYYYFSKFEKDMKDAN